MKISIKKAPPYHTNHTITAVWCDNIDCKQLPHLFIERKDYHGDKRLAIEEGVIVAELDFNLGAGYIESRKMYLCTDCIDLVFQDMRKVMDKSLWLFH